MADQPTQQWKSLEDIRAEQQQAAPVRPLAEMMGQVPGAQTQPQQAAQQSDPNPAFDPAKPKDAYNPSDDDVSAYTAIHMVAQPDVDLTGIQSDGRQALSRSQSRDAWLGSVLGMFKDKGQQAIVENAINLLKAGKDPDQVMLGANYAAQYMHGLNSDIDPQIILNAIAHAAPLPTLAHLDQLAAYTGIYELQKAQIAAGLTPGKFEWSDASDLIGTGFKPTYSYNTEQVAKKLGYNNYEDFKKQYGYMTPFDKMKFWQDNMPAIFSQFNQNSIMARGFVEKTQAFDSTLTHWADRAFDVLVMFDDVKLGFSLAKGARMSLSAADPMAQDVINAERAVSDAGRLANAGARQAAADASLSKVADAAHPSAASDAAKNLSPFNLQGTVVDTPRVIDGVAPEMLNRLMQSKAVVTEDDLLKQASDMFREDLAAKAEMEGQSRRVLSNDQVNQAYAELDDIAKRIESGQYYGAGLKDLKLRAARLNAQLEANAAADARTADAARIRAGNLNTDEKMQLGKQQAALRKAISEAPITPEQAARDATEAEYQRIEKELGLKLDRAEEETGKAGGTAAIKLRLKAAKQALKDTKEQLDAKVAAGHLTEEEAADQLKTTDAYREHQTAKSLDELDKSRNLTREQLDAVRTRDVGPDLRAKIRAIGEAARAQQLARLGTNPTRAAQQQIAKEASGPLSTVSGTGFNAQVGSRASEKVAQDAGAQATSPNYSSFGSSIKEVNDLVDKSVRGIRDFMQPFKNGSAFWNPAHEAFIRDRIEADSASFGKLNQTIRSAEVTRGEMGKFSVAYKLADGTDEIRHYEWNMDSLGHWTTTSLNGKSVAQALKNLAGGMLTPTTLLSKIDKDIVANFTMRGNQSSLMYNRLIRRVNEIFAPLNNEERRRIEGLLMMGDEDKVTYAVDDLLFNNVSVIDKDGIKQKGSYSVKEVNAYIQLRTMYDQLHATMNESAWRHFDFLKARELHIQDAGDFIVRPGGPGHTGIPGRVETMIYPMEEEATRAVGVSSPERVMVSNGTKTEYRNLSQADVQALKDQGYEAYKFHYHRDPDGERVSFAMVAADGDKVAVKPLRPNVLPYAEGFIPRTYKPGQVFVKDQYFNTVAGFDGWHAAQKWVADEAVRNPDRKLTPWRDREMAPEDVHVEQFNNYGGLFFMRRGDRPVTDPRTGEVIDRFDLAKATQRYLSGISEILPMNEYRSAVLRQFEDAVNAVAKQNGRSSGFADSWDLRSTIQTGTPDADRALADARDYLFSHLSIPTAEENRWAGFIGSLSDMLEGKPLVGGGFRTMIRNTAGLSPTAMLKGLVFNAYMGMFNARQLWVQGQNAVTAMSAYPQHTLGAFYDAMRISMVYMGSRETIDELAKTSKIDFSSAYGLAALLKRSGYLDSVFRNEDFRTLQTGVGGMAKDTLASIMRLGAKPFEAGELGARVLSFNICLRKFLAENADKDITTIDDHQLQQIVQDSMRLNMNMQKENAARFQTNSWASVPTQFLQVEAKFMENVLGGILHNTGKDGHTGWSRKEAMMILGGQLALFGAVGVPVAQWASTKAKAGYEHVFGNSQGPNSDQVFNMNHPDAARLMDEGAFGHLAHLLGLNINVTEDFSLLAGLDSNAPFKLVQWVTDLQAGNQDAMKFSDIAPTIQVIDRGKTSLVSLIHGLQAVTQNPGATPEIVLATADKMMQFFSSWNNWRKADYITWLGREIAPQSMKTTEIMHPDEYNGQTELAHRMGFKLESEVTLQHMIEDNKDIKANEDAKVRLIEEAMLARAKGNNAMADHFMDYALHDTNPMQQSKLQQQAIKNLVGPSVENSARTKLFTSFLTGNASDLTTNLTEAHNE